MQQLHIMFKKKRSRTPVLSSFMLWRSRRAVRVGGLRNLRTFALHREGADRVDPPPGEAAATRTAHL